MAHVSLNPKDFSKGGGLIDDVDVTFQNVCFEMMDLTKGQAGKSPYLKAELNDGGELTPVYWSCGSAQFLTVTSDGEFLDPVGDGKRLNSNSNAGMFFTSLDNAGFPMEELDKGISSLNGLQAHIIRVSPPKRRGVQTTKEGGFEPSVVTVDRIIALPGEQKDTGKKKAAGKSAPAVEVDSDIEATVEAFVVEKLTASPSGVAKRDITRLAFKEFADPAEKAKVAKLLQDDTFLADSDRPWSYKDGVVSL